MSKTHLLTTLTLVASTLTARAVPIDDFVLTSGSDIATFSLPASPTPSSYLIPDSFTMAGVPVTVDGVLVTASIIFFTNGVTSCSGCVVPDGGLDINNGADIIDQSGAVLFGNTPIPTPTFVPGTYYLTAYTATFSSLGLDSSLGPYKENFILTITPATSATSSTPEPSGFALLGTGILSLAGAARRRFKAG